MIATTVLFMSHWNIAVNGSVLLVMTFVLGFFLISTMPFNSFKEVEFIKARPSFVVFGVIVLVCIVAAAPAFMLFVLLGLYTVSGPVRWTAWKIQGKKGFQVGVTAPQAPALVQENVTEEHKPFAEIVKPGENIRN